MVTRLSLSATPGRNYGTFSGKTETAGGGSDLGPLIWRRRKE